MDSWIRYSVAVYIGLLMAGALVGPRPTLSIGPPPAPTYFTDDAPPPAPPEPHDDPPYRPDDPD